MNKWSALVIPAAILCGAAWLTSCSGNNSSSSPAAPVTVYYIPNTATPTITGTPNYHLVNAWGNLGLGNGQFNKPYAVAVDTDGSIYVLDTYNSRLQKLNSSGAYITEWGNYGYTFNYPQGLAIDSSGYVYVADSNDNRMFSYTPSGIVHRVWGKNGGDGTSGLGNGEFNQPTGVGVDPSGFIYVADFSNNRLQKFGDSGSAVTFISMWGKSGGDGTSGTGNGEFNNPWGVVVNATGDIYVTEYSNNRVQQFHDNGSAISFVRKWGKNGGDGSSGSGDGEFLGPAGLALDPQGNLFVADYNNGRIQEFTSSGVFIRKWYSAGSLSPSIFQPGGVWVDAAENVYVGDVSNNRILKFAP